MPITREQRDKIEDLVLRDPKVQRALEALGNANVCNESAMSRAKNKFTVTLDDAVKQAAQKTGVRLTERQSDVIENNLAAAMTEGMNAVPPRCPRR